MCLPMQSVIKAFTKLRERGLVAPIYVRMVIKTNRGEEVQGWLWRNPKNAGKPLETGETFYLTVNNGKKEAAVSLTWEPIFHVKVGGTEQDCRTALWFLHNNPEIRGGTHQSIDDFTKNAADWALATPDFFLVRCGKYPRDKELVARHPSNDALEWVKDPKRCLCGKRTRQYILDAMSRPYPAGPHRGEFVTVRRIFKQSKATA